MGQTLVRNADALEARETGHCCTDCGESLGFCDEVWCVQIVLVGLAGGKLATVPVPDENDVNRSDLFETYFFCFACWESHYDSLREDVSDEPPVEDGRGITQCSCCKSDIIELETAGSMTLGEFQLSRRSPNGRSSMVFKPNGQPDAICVFCMALFNETHMELWEGGVSQTGECLDCTELRCWRDGDGACGCSCHVGIIEPVEDDDEGE